MRVEVKGDTARFSDMGESVGFLFLHGVDLKPKSRQRWFFDTTLRRLSINATDSELYSEVPISDPADGLTRITEAIRSSQHIVMTAKSRSSLAFGDDVAEWLTEGNVDYRRSVDYAGLSGKHYQVDFELHLPSKQPAELLYTLHSETPALPSVLTNGVVVAFLEIREAGVRTPLYMSLDDTVDEDVWGPSLPLLRRRIDPVGLWEERDSFIEALASSSARVIDTTPPQAASESLDHGRSRWSRSSVSKWGLARRVKRTILFFEPGMVALTRPRLGRCLSSRRDRRHRPGQRPEVP